MLELLSKFYEIGCFFFLEWTIFILMTLPWALGL